MKAPTLILLASWLICAGSWAQPARPATAQVDSRDECMALQGTWKTTRDGWSAACEVPWERAECLRLGGAWTEVAKAGAGGRCLASISQRATAQQCLDRGGAWGPPGARDPQCAFEPARPRVVSRAADAGKLCDSQKDCAFGCVYQGPAVAAGADVMGRCRATNQGKGCYSMVEKGRMAGSVCVQ